jgi:hypothetical protein
MKHSRNLVRLVILLVLISIGLFHMPGGGLQTKASASKAPGAPPSGVAPAQIFWNSPPRVGVNSDGRLEVFVVGLDRTLWHNWQASGGWSGWYTLGGSLLGEGGVDGGGLAVDRNAYGALEVFAVWTDHSLRHNWQLTPGGAWSGWVSLGGIVYDAPSIARYSDGRLEVFAEWQGGVPWHIWQLRPAGAWSGWASLGVPIAGQSINGSPVVAMNAYGRPEVFVSSFTNDSDPNPLSLWHTWLNPNGLWSDWYPLGGSDNWRLAVTSNLDGRLEVFTSTLESSLLHIWQVTPTSVWSGWDRLGDGVFGDPVVARNTDGRLEVFAITESNSDLVHAWQLPGGGWSGLQSLHAELFKGVYNDLVGVGRNVGGGLEVFVIGNDGKVWHKWQISSGWSDWWSL